MGLTDIVYGHIKRSVAKTYWFATPTFKPISGQGGEPVLPNGILVLSNGILLAKILDTVTVTVSKIFAFGLPNGILFAHQ